MKERNYTELKKVQQRIIIETIEKLKEVHQRI